MSVGLTEGWRSGISLLSAAIWWAVFTIIPFRRLRNRPPGARGAGAGRAGPAAASGSSRRRCKDLRNYPVTLTFLLAYLFYNDGIQTVIDAASVYGEKQLGFEHRPC